MMKYLSNLIILIAAICLLSSCQSTTVMTRVIDSDFVARSHGFTKKIVKGGDFWITTYQKITNKNLPYVFYIEGDGLAFLNRYTISENPTPTRPMFLKLATMDERQNVIYVARPCQFTPVNLNSKCSKPYWTNLRMSKEVVDSLDEVIKTVNSENQAFNLVGYSGGGGIAVLIAAQNELVKDIVTIAGNLDIVSFNKHHKTPPMLGSLNPIDYVVKLKNIPQLHISGGNDTVVPPFIADKFVQASNSPCVHQHIFDIAKHSKGWEGAWKYILNMPVICHK